MLKLNFNNQSPVQGHAMNFSRNVSSMLKGDPELHLNSFRANTKTN